MCVHPAGIFTMTFFYVRLLSSGATEKPKRWKRSSDRCQGIGGNRLFLRCTTGERKADETRRDTLTNCINIDESFNFLLRE
jgi:hypothetical protein